MERPDGSSSVYGTVRLAKNVETFSFKGMPYLMRRQPNADFAKFILVS
jgi:acyl CoA:acetate/3-ketoacid CoA transferase alpha subunit